ncbi:hypothetical protein CL634_08435 [bacterium]|nr:hypothetical protein [bacterium]
MSRGFVYRWTNSINGNWYIGSHEGTTDDGYVASGMLLIRAINKHEIKNFHRDIMYRGDDFREQEGIILTILDAANDPKSYNLKNTAFGGLTTRFSPMLGKKHTAETKRKMSLASKGKKKSLEHRKNIGRRHKGKIVSEETRSKLRACNIGKTHTEETKRKISETLRLRRN